jgi:hypothetical protein
MVVGCSTKDNVVSAGTAGPTSTAWTTPTTAVPAAITVTLGQPAELGYHDALAVNGTGCVDPSTGSGDGLIAAFASEAPASQQGPLFLVSDPELFHQHENDLTGNAVSVNADGSFSGYIVAFDDAASGVISVEFACARPWQPPGILARSKGYERITLRPDLGGITFTPATVHPGETVHWRVDCGPVASPGYTHVSFNLPGTSVSEQVSEGHYASGTAQIPETATNTGAAEMFVIATCETQRVGKHRYPTGVLTIQSP